MWSHFMSRWTAYLIAAATVAGAFSIPFIVPAAAAPAAGSHARGAAATPMSYGARPVHRAHPRALAPRPHAQPAGHGRWQGRHGRLHGGAHGGWRHGSHDRLGRHEQHRGHGHHRRRSMSGYGAAGWGSVYVAPAPVYGAGYAEPPLQWTHAEPDLAPCVRPLIIQIGAPVYNHPTPQVTYGAAGCGEPKIARYVVGPAVTGPRVLDVAGEPSGRGRVVRARH
jgi:hypothetical protein